MGGGAFRRPLAVLNIGGVANITWIGAGEDEILAFDTGPGNALMDDWMREHTGKNLDEGGAIAASGTADQTVIGHLLSHPFFSKAPPKSLDRNAFATFARGQIAGMSLADGAATLLHFTARSIAAAQGHLPSPPTQWLVAGGGRHNATLMQSLGKILPNVHSVDFLGWNGDALEAEAFAFLAVRSLLGLPLSLPSTTGVREPVSGGVVVSSQ